MKSWEYFRSDNISLETSFSWLSDDIVRFKIEMGVAKKCTKISTPFQMDFPHMPVTPQHAVVINDVIIIGRRHVYCASKLLGRCLCKRIDVYIITLSCTWQIYALSECLLVMMSGCRPVACAGHSAGVGYSARQGVVCAGVTGWRRSARSCTTWRTRHQHRTCRMALYQHFTYYYYQSTPQSTL